MKNVMKRLTALSLATFMFALVPATIVNADDRSYTYNYDYWGDVQDTPNSYTVGGVFTSSDLNLDIPLKSPSGLTCVGDLIYVCDSGNNRILELKRPTPQTLEVVRIIDSYNDNGQETALANPMDVAVSENGDFYIADNGSGRVIKLDKDLNLVLEFTKPDDSTLNADLEFQPTKLAIDTADRVYCIATGINKGLIKYEEDGTFSGFVGATKVTFDWTDYIWKRLATQEQRAQMESFVPTQYDNLYMDHEGFIYACTGSGDKADIKSGDAQVVRKLNLMGNDILVRNGNWHIIGDLYMGNGGGYEGASYFSDVTCFDNDIYICLDRNRGRLFGYDDQGHMVYAFGSNGNIDGYFRRPVAIDHIGYDLFVLDNLDCSITVFSPTEFGNLVYEAIDKFDQGKYDESGNLWKEVMALNGNYDLAYIGIGRTLLRQEEYHEAMKYFEVKYDRENWSKAFKQYRKEWVEENIATIIAVILALVLIPAIIKGIKKAKYEVDTADIFDNK